MVQEHLTQLQDQQRFMVVAVVVENMQLQDKDRLQVEQVEVEQDNMGLELQLSQEQPILVVEAAVEETMVIQVQLYTEKQEAQE